MASCVEVDARVIDAIRTRLSVDRWTLAETAQEQGMSPRTVQRLAVKHGMDRPDRIEALRRSVCIATRRNAPRSRRGVTHPPIPEVVVDVIRIRLGVDRWTLTEVGREVGLSKDVVARVAADHAMDRPSRQEALANACRRPEARARRAQSRGVTRSAAPAWVPADLVQDYLDLSADFGIVEAKSRVRRLMRDVGASE